MRLGVDLMSKETNSKPLNLKENKFGVGVAIANLRTMEPEVFDIPNDFLSFEI